MSGGKAKGAEGKGKGKDIKTALPRSVKTALPRSSLSPELELLEWRKDVKVLKGFFQSFLWKYPVHAFVGEVVKARHFMTSYYDQCPQEMETKNQLVFNHYCHMISGLIKAYNSDFGADQEDTAYRLNFDISDCLPPAIKDRKGLAIPMNACSYLVAVYSYESFKYITESYAMDLKQYCIDAVEKHAVTVAKKWQNRAAWDKVDYLRKKSKDFFEEKLNYSMLKDKSVLTWCIKCTTPIPFVHEKKFTTKELTMPVNKQKWEEYLLQIYDTTLTALLDKQKSSYDKGQSKKLMIRNKEIVDVYLPKLEYILISRSMTQEEISEGLAPCTSPTITILRSGLEKTV